MENVAVSSVAIESGVGVPVGFHIVGVAVPGFHACSRTDCQLPSQGTSLTETQVRIRTLGRDSNFNHSFRKQPGGELNLVKRFRYQPGR